MVHVAVLQENSDKDGERGDPDHERVLGLHGYTLRFLSAKAPGKGKCARLAIADPSVRFPVCVYIN